MLYTLITVSISVAFLLNFSYVAVYKLNRDEQVYSRFSIFHCILCGKCHFGRTGSKSGKSVGYLHHNPSFILGAPKRTNIAHVILMVEGHHVEKF